MLFGIDMIVWWQSENLKQPCENMHICRTWPIVSCACLLACRRFVGFKPKWVRSPFHDAQSDLAHDFCMGCKGASSRSPWCLVGALCFLYCTSVTELAPRARLAL
jgi:hypothetical protein